jgi:membrane protein implicated in regulation of membrane protease activity
VRRPDDGPGILVWLVASASLILPWVGLGFILVGLWELASGGPTAWWLVIAGAAAVAADLAIDLVWAHPRMSASDQPDLNSPTRQLVGRVLVVAETIKGGRGKVHVGDTLWPAEGPDTAAGARVRVKTARATVLIVEPLQESDAGSSR